MGVFGRAVGVPVVVEPSGVFGERAVARVARAAGEPWPAAAADVSLYLADATARALTARVGPDVWGYCLFGVHRHYYTIYHLVVHPDRRRQGAGGALVRAVLRGAADRNRHHVAATVREDDRARWYCLRSHGFKGVRLVKGCYPPLDGIRLVRECVPGEVIP